ncbi:hypothetical protein [Corynebacterium sp. A21]|uniref:hypothetical protein n=1 Tax=Corynebacterium sp. A21 TaxID=3457318 RepID=UPI003FD32BB7
MGKFKPRSAARVSVIALASVLAMALSWVAVGAQENNEEPEITLVPDTDSVDFSAGLRAAEKPPEVLSRYSRTTIGSQVWETTTAGEGKTTAQSGEVSVGSGSAIYSSDVCVQGGEGAEGLACWNEGDVSGAATTNGAFSMFVNSSLLGLGLDTPLIGAAVQNNSLNTQVRCFLDEEGQPRAEATPPTGIVEYGGASTLGLITSGVEKDIAQISNDTPWIPEPKRVGSLLGWGDAYVRLTPSWTPEGDSTQAYSGIELSFRSTTGGLLGLIPSDSGWITLTVRSECGFTMSGEEQQLSPLQAPDQSPLRALQNVPETTQTSASGAPQTSGFTTEDTLYTEAIDYQLLATRELDALDRLIIEEVLAEISETGEVEGSNWKLFSAEAADEQIPVIEIELADGAIVQVRPIIPGAVLPSSDLLELTSIIISPAPSTTFTSPTISETSESTSISTSTEPTETSDNPTEPAAVTTRENDE